LLLTSDALQKQQPNFFMAPPKIIWEPKKDSNSNDKKIIESLIGRLNEKIQKNPTIAHKAALIIENWLKQKPKKK